MACSYSKRNGEFLYSPSFTLPNFRDTTWRLKIYPKGDKSENSDFMSFFLRRKTDKGPENININVTLETIVPHVSLKFDENFSINTGHGYSRFVALTEIQDNDPLIIVCELRLLDSKHPGTPSNVERLLPSSLELESDNVLSVLKEVDSQNYENPKTWFQYPGKVFSQTVFRFDKSFVQLTLDTSFVTGQKLKQIIPIISASAKCPPLLLTVSRCKETNQNDKADENLTVDFRLLNGKTKKSLLMICQVSVVIDDVAVTHLPAEEHLFCSEEKDEIWKLKETLDASSLSVNLKDSLSNSAIFEIEFISADGEVRSDILWEKSAEVVNSFAPCSVSILSNQMLRFYNDKKYCDAVLKVGNKTYEVHRTVLASMSPVFAAMFDSDMTESTTGTVDIADLDEGTVDKLVDFMYRGTLENLKFEDAQKLFFAADKYRIIALINLCRKCLLDAISFSNVCEILSIADRHSDSKLKEAAIQFICFYERVVLNSEDWKKLKKENLALACEVLEETCCK